MSKNAQLRSYSVPKCLQSCDNQKQRCLMGTGTNPNPRNAYYKHLCYTQHNQCVTSCTSNNIRSGRR